MARSGYVNLLQPGDRRSRDAGDSKASVSARARLRESGVGAEVFDHVIRRAAALPLSADAVVADLGSGSGDALAALAAGRAITGIGLDLSTAAAEHAARRFPHLAWIVANADRRLPLLDGAVDLVLSIHARRNPAECGRVLATGGHLLVAVPAADDLVELRAIVQGQGIERDRTEGVLADHAPLFTLVDRTEARQRQRLGRDALHDLLRGTYRGERLSTAGRVEALDSLDVTLASDVLLFVRRSDARGRHRS